MKYEVSLTCLHEQNIGPYTEPDAVRFSLKVHSPLRNFLVHEAQSFFIIIWFVRLLALRPLLAYCASLG
jgi:hypothetical protein